MTQLDRLTVDEIEEIKTKYIEAKNSAGATWPYIWTIDTAVHVLEQLADTIRENERLRLLIEESIEWISACDGQYTDLYKKLLEALSNKDSDNG